VRVEQIVELAGRDVEDRRAGRLGRTSAVDQGVDAAELAQTRGDQRVGDLRIGG
jgi:hypothetical protein